MRARHAHPDALSAQAKLTALNLPFMRENYQPLAGHGGAHRGPDFGRLGPGVNGCQETLFSGCEGAVLVFGL